MFLGLLLNSLTSPSKAGTFASAFVEDARLNDYFCEQANVVSPIHGRQKGRVQLHGVYWFAKLADPAANVIQAGSSVSVVDKENNTLIVVLAN